MDKEKRAAMERGYAKARSRLATPDAKVERWFWLSFADRDRLEGDPHLGCCVVVADDFAEAVAASFLLKINPGGECNGRMIVDDGTVDQAKLAFMLNKLRSRAEMAAVGLF